MYTSPGRHPLGKHPQADTLWEDTPLADIPLDRHPSRNSHCSRQYASYWNAFLLTCVFGEYSHEVKCKRFFTEHMASNDVDWFKVICVSKTNCIITKLNNPHRTGASLVKMFTFLCATQHQGSVGVGCGGSHHAPCTGNSTIFSDHQRKHVVTIFRSS